MTAAQVKEIKYEEELKRYIAGIKQRFPASLFEKYLKQGEEIYNTHNVWEFPDFEKRYIESIKASDRISNVVLP